MLKLKNKFEIFALQNHEEGELALAEDTHTYYCYKDGKWVEQNTDISISLYETQLNYHEAQENLTIKKIKEGKRVIKNFMRKHPAENYMFLNNEMHYYTIFQKGGGSRELPNELYDILVSDFDNIKAIHLREEEDGVAVWGTLNGQLGMFLFFDYDRGVVKCL